MLQIFFLISLTKIKICFEWKPSETDEDEKNGHEINDKTTEQKFESNEECKKKIEQNKKEYKSINYIISDLFNNIFKREKYRQIATELNQKKKKNKNKKEGKKL